MCYNQLLVILLILVLLYLIKGPKDQKEVRRRMNKYELALVVSANVEDEVRNATVEQVKELITRFGGTITDPGTCEKKKLAYEIQHMSEGYYNFIKFEADAATPAEVGTDESNSLTNSRLYTSGAHLFLKLLL